MAIGPRPLSGQRPWLARNKGAGAVNFEDDPIYRDLYRILTNAARQQRISMPRSHKTMNLLRFKSNPSPRPPPRGI